MTPTEAFADIAAVAESIDFRDDDARMAAIRALLDQVEPEPTVLAFDREKARDVLWRYRDTDDYPFDDVLDLLAACVVSDPPPTKALKAAEALLHELGYVKSTDHVTGSVQWYRTEAADPPPTIDRDALIELIKGREWRYWNNPSDVADDILALVRPVGVVLTPEEAALLLTGEHVWPAEARDLLVRLRAARLEEASS